MVDDVDLEKLQIRPPERSSAVLKTQPSSSKSGGSGRRKLFILSMKYFFHTRRYILNIIKELRHGDSGFSSPPMEVVLRIFIAVNNPSP
jgi:hypothetical protein